MLIHELMSSPACAIEPETTIRQAATLMDRLGVGVLVVLRGRHAVGIVTDRDLAVRGLARGLAADTPVARVMTQGVHACHADEHVTDVLLDMELLQIGRVPVENEDDEFIGMLGLEDLARVCTDVEIGRAFKRISARVQPTEATPQPSRRAA